MCYVVIFSRDWLIYTPSVPSLPSFPDHLPLTTFSLIFCSYLSPQFPLSWPNPSPVVAHAGTGLYTSPHLLEVTERVRCDGKPLSKDAFARYFFQVWDRLQATAAATTTTTHTAAAKPNVPDMPTYFHLLTLVGLWCFVQEGVDVCVLEVGMGGRFDATNVVPSPVACGVTALDLDHTQVCLS